MPKPWTERRVAAHRRAVTMRATRNLRALGIDPLGLPPSRMRLSDVFEAAADASAVEHADSLTARVAAFAERDPRLQDLSEQMTARGREVRRNLNAGRTARAWRGVDEMRRFALGLATRLVAPIIERGQRFAPGGKRGRLDALDRVLLKLLRETPGTTRKRPTSDELLAILKSYGHGIYVGPCRHPARHNVRRGPVHRSTSRRDGRNDRRVVEWPNPKTGNDRCVAWSSIVSRRLPRLRKLPSTR